MAVAALYLGAALLGGLIAVMLRLPPLVGFLAAGFVLGATGAPDAPYLEPIADLGVVLLLFAIGLKLDVRTLLRREIWLTTAAHLAVSVAVGLGFLGLLAVIGVGFVSDEPVGALALVGFALSFSSTVFVVKVLDDRSDTTSLYGRIAVGVLVMQDVAAVVFLSLSSGEPPTPWALLLLLLIPGAWVLHRVWDRVGHGELQALFGVAVAVVLGYGAFEIVGIDGDVGALVVGVLLASHPQAGELSRSLMTFKDLMLIAFFVTIGLHGTPHWLEIGLAALLLLILPVQMGLYAVLLWLMRLRRRTSFLAALVLSNYSEFGIIVAAVGASVGMLSEQWVVVVSLAVAFSFGLSAIVNRRGVELATRLSRLLPVRDEDRIHPLDRLVDVGDADALVLGLGRVGAATYARLRDEYGLKVVGVEHDAARVAALEDEGYRLVRADATDLEFWSRVQRAGRVKVAVLAMPFHNANLIALSRLHAAGFSGKVAAVARYDDDVAELERHGADAVFHLYGSAGFALADHAAEVLLAVDGPDRSPDEPRSAGRPPQTGRPAHTSRPAHPPARPGQELDVLDPLQHRVETS